MTRSFQPRQQLGHTGFIATQLGIGDIADRNVPLKDCVATIHRALRAIRAGDRILVSANALDLETMKYNVALFTSDDRGATWSLVANGLPANHFVSVVRPDPVKAGLLYAGTDDGHLHASMDDGKTWTRIDTENYNAVAFTPTGTGWAVGPKQAGAVEHADQGAQHAAHEGVDAPHPAVS